MTAVPDVKPSSVVVVDLDGTLADLNHRLPLIRSARPDWNRFYSELVYEDTPNEWCVRLIRSMCESGFWVIIVSARSADTYEWTRKWLWDKAGLYKEWASCALSMEMLRSSNKDCRPDIDIKRDWLHKFGKEKILFVVDDRQRVVDMWREEGLTCLQCNAWEEFKRPKFNVADHAREHGFDPVQTVDDMFGRRCAEDSK